MIFDQNPSRIMTRGWHVRSDFGVVTSLVLSRPSLPSGLFFGCQVLVHVARVFRQLPESHARVFTFELLPHCVLIEQISAQVSLGCVGILFRLSFPTVFASNRRNDSISLGVVSRWRVVAGQFMQISCLISFGTSDPCFLFCRREFRIHRGGVLCQLSKGHSWVECFELLSHCILIKQIRTHIAFRSARVSLWTFSHRIAVLVVCV
mmetsp:Transcript_29213/g.48611  ORF Transcript_29213/g.48611 Transcript_29213/m.48611 type:complete len:206 (+) Transcript_29213:1320-1937(+)